MSLGPSSSACVQFPHELGSSLCSQLSIALTILSDRGPASTPHTIQSTFSMPDADFAPTMLFPVKEEGVSKAK